MSNGTRNLNRESQVVGFFAMIGMVLGFTIGYRVSGGTVGGGLGGMFPGFFVGMLLWTIASGLSASDH